MTVAVKRPISDWPREDRPRERVLDRGTQHLSEAELLAVLIGTGDPRSGHNAVDVARGLLGRFDGLAGLPRAAVRELLEAPGLGPAKAARILVALEMGRRLSSLPAAERPLLCSSRDVYRAYGGRLRELDREVFLTVLLDARNRRFREVTVSEGSLTTAVVHPREVYAMAVRECAAAILCIHNHPSGDPTPSPEDVDLTHRLAGAGELLGIPLVDHVIIGRRDYTSFADQGFLGRRHAYPQGKRPPRDVMEPRSGGS